jgi:GT2 family glycosyltransferase
MTNSNGIAIGIISCERGATTQRCLDSIRATTRLPYHIYIVDNGSRSDSTRPYLDRWQREKDITVRRLERNYGPSVARNCIIEMAEKKHDIFAMLDNDIIVLDRWDVAALAAIDRGFDVVQPKFLNPDRKTVGRGPTRPWDGDWLVHPEYLGRGLHRHSPEVGSQQTVQIFAGTAIIRARVLESVGGYDPRIWAAEDYDLAYRAAAAGFVACYEPECEMVHDHGYDFEYDQMRFDPERALTSHSILWEKHQRLLLPPAALRFYLYLVENRKPMFIPHKKMADALLARVWRRVVHFYFFRRYGEVWPSRELGETVTEDLRRRLPGVATNN